MAAVEPEQHEVVFRIAVIGGAGQRFVDSHAVQTRRNLLPRSRFARCSAWWSNRAADELRYGTVAINYWPAIGYGTGTPPWGGHPSSTLQDAQRGIWSLRTARESGARSSARARSERLSLAPRPAPACS